MFGMIYLSKMKTSPDTVKPQRFPHKGRNGAASEMEAVLARGDRRLCDVLYAAWKSGCKFDGWNECFSLSRWMEAFDECGIDTAFYANRGRDYSEINAVVFEVCGYCISAVNVTEIAFFYAEFG